MSGPTIGSGSIRNESGIDQADVTGRGARDGRVPVRPEAEAKRDYDLAHLTDSYEHMSVWDRCITRGVPPHVPRGYNNAIRSCKFPATSVILYEMIQTRGSSQWTPPASSVQRQDVGWRSRGRWQGDTLVVDTTNYNSKGWDCNQRRVGTYKRYSTERSPTRG